MAAAVASPPPLGGGGGGFNGAGGGGGFNGATPHWAYPQPAMAAPMPPGGALHAAMAMPAYMQMQSPAYLSHMAQMQMQPPQPPPWGAMQGGWPQQ